MELRPGVREDDLAVELRWYMKSLGAEDNFLMLNAGPHNKAVQPCSSRRMEAGDLLLTELSPIYRGQMTQICRTIVMGRASEAQKRCYEDLKQTAAHMAMLPFMNADIEEAVREMGEDYWPFGFEKNEKVLETFLRYHYQGGLSKRLLKPAELFAPETLEAFKI